MNKVRMIDEVKDYNKEYVYDSYSRIVKNYKEYDKVTKKKMVEEIYKVYNDTNNIIDICTYKELKYLELILNNTNQVELQSYKYLWERTNLIKKFLLIYDFENIYIPLDIEKEVKEALSNVKWKEVKEKDKINEVLIGYEKIYISSLFYHACSHISNLLGIDKEKLRDHMINNKLFNFYVTFIIKEIEDLGEDIPILLDQDYFYLEEDIEKERSKHNPPPAPKDDVEVYKSYFYNDFDIHNKKVKKMLDTLDKLPVFQDNIIRLIKECSILNGDRDIIKNEMLSIRSLSNIDLSNFFSILDEALDEMPSAVLNGLSPNKLKELKSVHDIKEQVKEIKHIKQKNACLSKKDANLFYKLYFALLEFTNDKYHIKKNLKIYNSINLDPSTINDIIEVFWKNKNDLINSFISTNKYNFTNKELSIIKDFKKGIRTLFIIVKYEEEYTALMSQDKTYMIKGINSNIDEVISYKNLPKTVMTTILPFKDNLIYDSIFVEYGITISDNIEKIINKDYSTSLKYYHL
jgi:hypothetical protein